MARKTRTTPSTTSGKRTKTRRSRVPEPFHIVSSATIERGSAKIRVPMLVLYGEWLKAVGFPIGSSAIVTTDSQGELALHRLGLGVPRRFRVRSLPR